jgi:RNA polymerase sigma-70 factor (ECF subfamily)
LIATIGPGWLDDSNLSRGESPSMALMQRQQASTEPSGKSATGHSETIEELFMALESPLLAYAMRLAGQVEWAEDIVQEAFMRLHANFDDVREPKKWLYRTVHNLALNYRRDSGKIVPLDLKQGEGAENVDTMDPQPLPDEQIARLEGIGLVRLSLKTLDKRSRELVRLKFNEGMSYKEIAGRTGLTVSHVGYLLHHAIKAIADELAKNGVVR